MNQRYLNTRKNSVGEKHEDLLHYPCSNRDSEFHENSSLILVIVFIFNDKHFY